MKTMGDVRHDRETEKTAQSRSDEVTGEPAAVPAAAPGTGDRSGRLDKPGTGYGQERPERAPALTPDAGRPDGGRLTSASAPTASDRGTSTSGTSASGASTSGTSASVATPASSSSGKPTVPAPRAGADPVGADTDSAEKAANADGADDLERLSRRMERAVGGFVDDPRRAVREADAVLEEATSRLTRLLEERRSTLRGSWHGDNGERTGTEELRVALTKYRDMTRQLLTSI
jgi:hypothetical protein